MNSDLADARAALTAVGATVRDVRLPGDPLVDPRMGSIVMDFADGSSVDVFAWDYGQTRRLFRTPDLREAVATVVQRLRPEPVNARRVTREDWQSWCSEAARSAASLDAGLDNGLVVETSLPAGMVVDRFGDLDGFLLYPAGLPFARRSLPPSALDPSRRDLGLTAFGVVRPIDVLAARVAPAFEQPGGGVVFRLRSEQDTVRDALRRGDLTALSLDLDDGSPSDSPIEGEGADGS